MKVCVKIPIGEFEIWNEMKQRANAYYNYEKIKLLLKTTIINVLLSKSGLLFIFL